MVKAKRKGDASSSKSNPETENVAGPVQTETTTSSLIKLNVEETVVVPVSEAKEEMVVEETKTEENAMEKEEDEDNNGENETEEEGNENNAIEEEENNEEIGSEEEEEEEEEESEETAVEEEKPIGKEEKAIEKEENAIEIEENEENSKEGCKNEKNTEEGTEDQNNTLKKDNKRKKVAKGGSEAVAANKKDKPESSGKKKEAVAANNKGKPESSRKKKSSKKVESMGMIFMCSSKTKKDCFRYKVLGLPESKRDVVQKIYKGMRVFLFDLDLRLMYGIYKAAAPGGYNIEPKAFKSAFPSQVRFTVMEDCLPLAEEKFKMVIKENYFGNKKFDCQLNSTQVKNLCKLFVAANKGPKPIRPPTSRRAETLTVADQDRVRDRARDDKRRAPLGGGRRYQVEERDRRPTSGRKRRYPEEERRNASGGGERRYRDEERRPVAVVERRYRDEERLPPVGGDRLYHERPIVYEREAFGSPLTRVQHLPPPAPASYNYGRTSEIEAYRQQPFYEHRERQLLDLDQRPRVVIEQRDPYSVPYGREPPLYRDSLYARGLPAEYHPAGSRSEYRTPGFTSEYRTPAAPPTSEYRLAEYTTHRPMYRY